MDVYCGSVPTVLQLLSVCLIKVVTWQNWRASTLWRGKIASCLLWGFTGEEKTTTTKAQTCKDLEIIKVNIQKTTNEHLRTPFYIEKQKHPVASTCLLLGEATGTRNTKDMCLKWQCSSYSCLTALWAATQRFWWCVTWKFVFLGCISSAAYSVHPLSPVT